MSSAGKRAMDRSRLMIPLALILAVLIGAAGYCGVAAVLEANGRARREAAAEGRAALVGHAGITRRIAALEKRIEQLESRPSLAEKLDDQNVRRQLTELMLEARRRDREAEELKRRKQRSERVVRWYRASYDRLLADARAACKAREESWAVLKPVFERHFEPVAKAVRERAGARGRLGGWVRVDINRAVAPVLPETVAALKKSLPAESWVAFDAWRRKASFNRYGQTPGAEYFLGAAELKQVRSRAAVERRWAVIRKALPELHDELELEGDTKKRLDAVLRKHAENFTAAFEGRPFVNVNEEDNHAKVVRIAALTDLAVKKLLGDADFAKYEKWKTDPDSRVRLYFGQDGDRGQRRNRRDRDDRNDRNDRGDRGDRRPRPARPGEGEVF